MSQSSRDNKAELAWLAQSQGHRLRSRYAHFLDNRTPVELQALLPQLDALSGEARSFEGARPMLELLRRERAQPFRQTSVSADVQFFSDATVPAGQKSLLITFAGSANLLMMPSSLFLQHLPATHFDVVCLKDRQNASYQAGLAGFPGPLPATVFRVALAVQARRYRGVYCLGTSMGGFPALMAGRLLKAKRAISVGGSDPWPINRLLAKQPAQIPSFELLCCCASASVTELINAFSGGFPRDVKSAKMLRKRMPVRLIRHDKSEKHNLAFWMICEGIFDRFLGDMLDFDPSILHRPLPHADSATIRASMS